MDGNYLGVGVQAANQYRTDALGQLYLACGKETPESPNKSPTKYKRDNGNRKGNQYAIF